MKQRAVVVHPPFGPYGGGELLAAWVLQALAPEYAVTLVCIEPVDWARVDARFGTTLAESGIAVSVVNPAWRRILRRWPAGADRLRIGLLERLSARRVPDHRPDDLWISTYNEMRMPKPGLQYVHSPTPGMLADDALEGLDGLRSPQRIYQALCRRLGGWSLVSHREHVTLVNSRFTAGAWLQMHGSCAEVVYPPVPPLTTGLPWTERADRVLCLGRLFLGKGIDRAVRIVEGVRARGIGVTLAVAGKWDCPAAERRALEQFLVTKPWVELHENPSRPALAALAASSRYGLHGMVREPFGIAVAELQDAGAITFAPAEGGPSEIIEDARLLYKDEAEAVEKFARVWGDPALQDDVRRGAAARIGRFSPERFMQDVRTQLAAVRARKRFDYSAVAGRPVDPSRPPASHG